MIFMTAFLVFFAAIINLTARATNSGFYADFSRWVLLPSVFGGILALFHFKRKLTILFRLWFVLGKNSKTMGSKDQRDKVRQVRRVTFTQILLVILRVITSGLACVALPWGLATSVYGDKLSTDPYLPGYLAIAAVGTAVAGFIFFFFVEFYVRYNLSPKLGEFVCESFRPEIEAMYASFSLPSNNIDTTQVQERETWEYVAREFLRKYRFDSVFAADRFGTILQYIQSGMAPR